MAQNYRNQPNRPDDRGGGRYQTGSERDRYRTGGEQRFNPDWQDRGARGFEGNRGYSQGGYSEEFGYRRGRNRDDYEDRGSGTPYYGSRGSSGANYQSGRSYGGDYDREGQSRYDEGRFDEGNRFREASSDYDDRDFGDAEFSIARDRGTSTSSWHEDAGDSGGYFGTGNYVDDGGSWRGFGGDFERARARVEQERDFGSYRDRERATSGEPRSFGRSRYGAQPSYGRGDYDRPLWGGRQGSYENRSSWDYGGEQRGSFRGKGPQGYQRSDERLKEMICERLTDDPRIDASEVTVEVNDQRVKLTGMVDDRGTKYEIEELIERFGGVKDIDNQLRVKSSRWGAGQESGTQTGQQARGGSDWEAGSSSTLATGSSSTGSSGRSETKTGSPSSGTTGAPGTGSTGRKN
jgi:hypothetical protein